MSDLNEFIWLTAHSTPPLLSLSTHKIRFSGLPRFEQMEQRNNNNIQHHDDILKQSTKRGMKNKKKKRGMLFGTNPIVRSAGDFLATYAILVCLVLACIPVVVYYLTLWRYL